MSFFGKKEYASVLKKRKCVIVNFNALKQRLSEFDFYFHRASFLRGGSEMNMQLETSHKGGMMDAQLTVKKCGEA